MGPSAWEPNHLWATTKARGDTVLMLQHARTAVLRLSDRCILYGAVWWKIAVGNNGALPEKTHALSRASIFSILLPTQVTEIRVLFRDVGAWGFKNDRFHIYNLKGKPLNDAMWSRMRKEGRRERVKRRELTWNEEHIFSCTAVEGVGVGSGSKTNTLWSECVHTCVCV